MSPRTNPVEAAIGRLYRRLNWALRGAWPNRRVQRDIQGVPMTLPWSHRLPDYTREGSKYGQNLVELAALLIDDSGPLTVLDVGANVGDSTLQILNVIDARVLCVEADGFFLDYLRANVGSDSRVTIEAALLTPDAGTADVQMAPVRVGGTTRFEPGSSGHTAPSVSTGDLRKRHPEFGELRLAKSDTDGYDVTLIPAIAEAWFNSKPVLFFEYDHKLSRLAGNDPLEVWKKLESLGYSQLAVWHNYGMPLGRLQVDGAAAAATALEGPFAKDEAEYWDVAVVHCDDVVGLAAIEKLVPATWASSQS